MNVAEQLQGQAAVLLAGAWRRASQGIETDEPALAELVIAKILAAAHLGACPQCQQGGDDPQCCELGIRLLEEAKR